MRENSLIKDLGQNFIEYAVAVNSDRAIPNIYDGLKPVAKRILYDTYITGHTSNKPYVKCARVVGSVMGRLHPHGRLSNWIAVIKFEKKTGTL